MTCHNFLIWKLHSRWLFCWYNYILVYLCFLITTFIFVYWFWRYILCIIHIYLICLKNNLFQFIFSLKNKFEKFLGRYALIVGNVVIDYNFQSIGKRLRNIESIVVVRVTLTHECIVSLNSYGLDVPWIVRFHKKKKCHLHKFIFRN